MVPSSNQKGNFVTFEGDDCKEDKLGLSKDVLGRRRKRRGIKIHENIVKKSIHQLQVDPSMFDKVQNKLPLVDKNFDLILLSRALIRLELPVPMKRKILYHF